MPGCASAPAGSPVAGPGRCCRAKRSCGSATTGSLPAPAPAGQGLPRGWVARGRPCRVTLAPQLPTYRIEVTVDFSLTDEERAIRDTARAFLRNEVLPL